MITLNDILLSHENKKKNNYMKQIIGFIIKKIAWHVIVLLHMF